jgi:hypothetical protein
MSKLNPFRFYQLLPDGTIQPCLTSNEVKAASSDAGRRVGLDMIGNDKVSTVFLNLEHGGGMWFESMIFLTIKSPLDPELDTYCWRYATLAEAKAGHAAIVSALRAGLDPRRVVAS